MKKQQLRLLNMVLLIIITIIGIALSYQLRYSNDLILALLFVSCVIYLVWAFIFHKQDKSLTLTVSLEYLLTAALVVILLLGVLVYK